METDHRIADQPQPVIRLLLCKMTRHDIAAASTIKKQKAAGSMSLLPPEIHLLIAESLPPKDQLHLGLTCKSLLFLAAPSLLGESILQHPISKKGVIYYAFHAGFVNVELYGYLMEHAEFRPHDFELICHAAGRYGDTATLELWSQQYGMPISERTAEGAAEAGQIAMLQWMLDRTPAAKLNAQNLIRGAIRNRREDAFDCLRRRLDLMPWELTKPVQYAAEAGHIDLAIILYCQLPLCCCVGIFSVAAIAIAQRLIHTIGWKANLAPFLETPSIVSDAVGWCVFESAVQYNRVDVMRYVDEICGDIHHQKLASALGSAIAHSSVDAFNFICQTRSDWTTFADDAIDRLTYLFRANGAHNYALLERVMPHVNKRSTLISLIHTAIGGSEELFKYAAQEFPCRFGAPSEQELVCLYSKNLRWEEIKLLAQHFPPRTTALANAIARKFNSFETIQFLRQFLPGFSAPVLPFTIGHHHAAGV